MSQRTYLQKRVYQCSLSVIIWVTISELFKRNKPSLIHTKMGDRTKVRFGYKGVMGKIDNDKKYGNNDF